MTKNIVALVDDLFFQQPIKMAAQSLGYDVGFATPTNDVVAYLVAKQPWLVIVDLNVKSIDWERWVTAAKTSPATRKIPILAFGSHMDTASIERARKVGCDAVVSNGAFMTDVAGMIQKHAKLDESEELKRQAREPLPELAKQAIEQFNQREFWEQHETFETVWRAEPGPIRQMYQGILQVGVAYYQIQRRNYDGACKLFQRAWQYLNALPDVSQGVDIAQLRADAQAAIAELERLGPKRIGEFDSALLKPIKLVDDAYNPLEGEPMHVSQSPFVWQPDESLRRRLNDFARRRGESEDAVVNTAVEQYLARATDDQLSIALDSEEDPLLGMFSLPADLAVRSKEILRREIIPRSGWTWKEPLDQTSQ